MPATLAKEIYKVMRQTNTVQLIGYLGADPAIKQFANGNKCARMRVATHTPLKKKNSDGSQQYSTAWHTVVAWAQSADFAERNFLKGSHILVDGRVAYRTYQDQGGQKKSVTEIIAGTLTNLDR
jgi:single-strand DNA-binding protein